jgi:anthranilate phosphoribosyltransferase
LPELVATVLGKLGSERAISMHGADGLDELSTTGETTLARWDGESVSVETVTPEAFGLARASLDELFVKSPDESAEAIRNVLAGRTGPHRDIVLLNAAAALYVADKADDIRQAIAIAEASIDSGQARQALETLVRISNAG